MNISKFLAKVMGIYFVIISIAMFLNRQQFISGVNDLINNAPLMFVVGFFTLILGILMIVSHNIWQLNWRVLVTIIAWLTFIKGTSILMYPHFLGETTRLFLQSSTALYCAAIFDFFLGILLSYFGFKK